MTFMELENNHARPVSPKEVGDTGSERNPMVNGVRCWRKPGLFCTLLANGELLIKFESVYWGFAESAFAVVSADVLADISLETILRQDGFAEVEI